MIILQDGMVSQFLISIALFTSASEGKKKKLTTRFQEVNKLIFRKLTCSASLRKGPLLLILSNTILNLQAEHTVNKNKLKKEYVAKIIRT